MILSELKVIGSLPASSVCSHSHFTREIPFLSTHLNHTQVNSRGINGTLHFPHREINLGDIVSVWYRRPVSSIPASELQDIASLEFVIQESKTTLEGLWNLLTCFWVSHPNKIRTAESKLYQLKIATNIGFSIPDTLITDNPAVAEEFYTSHFKSVIYKPLHQARIFRDDKVSLIYSTKLDLIHPKDFQNVKYAPVILQSYIPKSLEIRVTVVGQEVFAVELHTQEVSDAMHDWRRANIGSIKHRAHKLPVDMEQKCIKLVNFLQLQFGAIDMILTPDGEYVFLEINPNGQWAWVQQICPEILIRESLINLLLRGRID
jgi:glutathione synthase/RimK-type ligase-like ATP-grasp enzyme